ncbi:acylphosphatase [Luedemannella flava]|uniref:Acylphosphatase n=1 Tax=Luedemannella flava TaxID=349316 RepID=A0ABP4YZ83_9ACTN
MIRRRLVVSGEVQGVWFRDTCRRVATGAGVAGWVRNLPDGAVEAVVEGPPDGVAEVVAWARHGPDRATVEDLALFDEQPEGLRGFEIRPTPGPGGRR